MKSRRGNHFTEGYSIAKTWSICTTQFDGEAKNAVIVETFATEQAAEAAFRDRYAGEYVGPRGLGNPHVCSARVD